MEVAMGAKEQLSAWADEQGWDDNSKVDLLCRFIDNLDLLLAQEVQVHSPNEVEVNFVEVLDKWLENQVEWENHGNQEKGEDYDGS